VVMSLELTRRVLDADIPASRELVAPDSDDFEGNGDVDDSD
jgi:hypothetical protein